MGTEFAKARKPEVAKPRRVTPTTDVPARTAPALEPVSNALVAGDRSLVDEARETVADANARLPYLPIIQHAFGDHDLGTVRVAIGGAAAEFADAVGARAYTVGERIAFRSEPDLHLAAHEAAHVVHQRVGVNLEGGVGKPGDPYEQHANAIADAVVAGRSVKHLLGPATTAAARPALQMECDCGTCPTCVSRPWQPAVQFDGMGDVLVADARREKEAEENAGKGSGLTRDQLEEKFYRLAVNYSDYAFWRLSGPRDLGEWMDAHPGEIDTLGGPWKFNSYVVRQNPVLLHPVPLSQMMNTSVLELTADHYQVYEGARVHLQIDPPFTYVTRAHKFWARHIFGQYYLRFHWKDYTTATTAGSFSVDTNSEWRRYMDAGSKGVHLVQVEIRIGGSTGPLHAVTVALDAPLSVFDHAEFEAEFLRKTATEPDVEGTPASFTKDPDGWFRRKPGAEPATLEQQIVLNLVKLGALKVWHDEKKISADDYKKAKEYFEERNKLLESISLPAKDLYLMSGAFVGDELPQAVPIRAIMSNNMPTVGAFTVVLKDTTLDPKVATTHQGSASLPTPPKDTLADWVDMERRAIQDMGEHWRLNNDYPHGRVTLYIGSRFDPKVTFTITIPQQNWKKTLRTIFSAVAMIAAVAALAVGQAEIAVPLMIVGGAATLASVALGIEHRIKMGTFGWDKELLLDVLTVVSTFMGMGALSTSFKAFSVAGKVFYLVGLGTLDVAQGVLIGLEAKDQIEEARIDYHGKLVLATTDEQRQRLKKEFEARVAGIIGGAIASGAFIAVSTVGGIKGIREVRAHGAHGDVNLPKPDGEPVRPGDPEPTARPGADAHVDAASKQADFESWKSRLNDETRAQLDKDPNLRKTYEDMDPDVRRALTLCESPCIPTTNPPNAAQIAKIKAAMQKLGIPAEDFRLREYLHRNRGKKMKQAIEDLGKVNNPAELTALYDRSIAAHAKVGTATKGADGKWTVTKPDGTVVGEHTVATHGELTKQGTDGFFESHHGIQDKWAKDAGLEPFGYDRDACPAINLRDTHAGSPHQRITAAQKGRESGRGSRTYEDERLNLAKDMVRADVPDTVSKALLAQSDAYFGKIYRNVETQLAAAGKSRPQIDAALAKFFGAWKPK